MQEKELELKLIRDEKLKKEIDHQQRIKNFLNNKAELTNVYVNKKEDLEDKIKDLTNNITIQQCNSLNNELKLNNEKQKLEKN